MKVLVLGNSHSLTGGAHAAFLDHVKILTQDNDCVVSHLSLESFGINPDVSSRRSSVGLSKVYFLISYFFNFRVFLNVLRECRRFKPDIVHIHLYVGGLTVAAVVAAKIFGARVCHSVHDYRAICPRNALLTSKGVVCESCLSNPSALVSENCTGYTIQENYLLQLESRFRRALQTIFPIDHYIFVSDFSRTKHDSASINIPQSSVNYNFVMDSEVLATDVRESSSLPLSANVMPTLAFIGRFSIEKGITRLCEEFCKSNLNCKLMLIGGGPECDALMSLADQDDRIIFKGHLSRPEIFEMLRGQIDAMVLPAVWYENNPLSLIEAQMMGVPIIAAEIGGIPEIVNDEVDGLLFRAFDFGHSIDVIQRFLDLQPEELTSMRLAARENYEKTFTEERFRDAMKAIYREVIQSS